MRNFLRRAGRRGLALPCRLAQTESSHHNGAAAPGGGWDQTARAMQTVLQDEKIAGDVQVVNVPGAGGTIGLPSSPTRARATRAR
jgi:putative tricarboxylic transport membrane protein